MESFTIRISVIGVPVKYADSFTISFKTRRALKFSLKCKTTFKFLTFYCMKASSKVGQHLHEHVKQLLKISRACQKQVRKISSENASNEVSFDHNSRRIRLKVVVFGQQWMQFRQGSFQVFTSAVHRLELRDEALWDEWVKGETGKRREVGRRKRNLPPGACSTRNSPTDPGRPLLLKWENWEFGYSFRNFTRVKQIKVSQGISMLSQHFFKLEFRWKHSSLNTCTRLREMLCPLFLSLHCSDFNTPVFFAFFITLFGF